MPSKRTTTVVLTEKAREIKDRLMPSYGLKGILSVGLELFDKLNDTQKKNRVGNAIITDKKLHSKPKVIKTLKDLIISLEKSYVPNVLDEKFLSKLEAAHQDEAAAALPLKVEKHKSHQPDPLKAG